MRNRSNIGGPTPAMSGRRYVLLAHTAFPATHWSKIASTNSHTPAIDSRGIPIAESRGPARAPGPAAIPHAEVVFSRTPVPSKTRGAGGTFSESDKILVVEAFRRRTNAHQDRYAE